MKWKFIITLTAVMLVSIIAQAATYYVDPVNGVDSAQRDGSSLEQWRTLSYALSNSNDNDTIYIQTGDLYESVSSNCYVHINNLDNLTIQSQYSSFSNWGRLVGYLYPATPDSNFSFLKIEDSDGTTLKKIVFDGYNYFPGIADTSKAHITILNYGTADNTTIDQCHFLNMGRNIADSPDESPYRFEAIISGWGDSDNTLDYIEVKDCHFHDNPFEGHHAHEVYLHKTRYASITGNKIWSNAIGTPLKLRNDCQNTTFDNNNITGTAARFINDWPNPGDSYSSGTIVTNNTFRDSCSIIRTDDYCGPIICKDHNQEPLVTSFWGNDLTSDIEFSDTHEVRGITSDGTSVFAAMKKDTTLNAGFIDRFEDARSPLPQRCLQRAASGYQATKTVCVFSGDIIAKTLSGSTVGIFKIDKDYTKGENPGGSFTNNSYFYSYSTTSSNDITALSSHNSTYYLTGYCNNGTPKLYKGNGNTPLNTLIYTFASGDSITAITSNGTDVMVAVKHNGNGYRIYKGTISGDSYSPGGSPVETDLTVTKYVTALAFVSSDLVTAVQSGTTAYVYQGTANDPVGTLKESFSSTNVACLTGSTVSGTSLLHVLKTASTLKNKIFYTNDLSNIDKETYYYTYWWTSQFE